MALEHFEERWNEAVAKDNLEGAFRCGRNLADTVMTGVENQFMTSFRRLKPDIETLFFMKLGHTLGTAFTEKKRGEEALELVVTACQDAGLIEKIAA